MAIHGNASASTEKKGTNGKIMSKRIGLVLFMIGILFLLNAIFGRYIVLPGYFESLKAGVNASQIPENIPIEKVLCYLLWAFSFKLGIYFCVLAFMSLQAVNIKKTGFFAFTGFTYISTAYMDLPFNSTLFFGIGGGILTISAIVILWGVVAENKNKTSEKRTVLPIYGFFFIIMAAYNLCPFCGVKCFALEPEKMIKYGVQGTAISFANHIMIELVFGFVCLAIHYYLKNRNWRKV